MDLLRGRRGFIVPNILGKEAKKQYDKSFCFKRFKSFKSFSISQDCKYETEHTNTKPGEVLLKGETVLFHIWKRNKENPYYVNKRLWSILKHDDIWINSFLKLSDNQKAKPFGAESLQLTDYTLEQVMMIKQQVLNGSFKWSKSENFLNFESEKQILNVKLVQKVLKTILACIYEPIFDNHSHGFRVNRSVHTALSDVRKNFKGCKWVLEGQIAYYFDNISHNRLKTLLNKKIKDDRFISLIYTGLKSKVLLNFNKEINNFETLLISNFSLDSLLFNIYLHPFDKYVTKLSKLFNVGLQQYQSKLNKKLAYVRYADNFIVGLDGSKAEAQALKNKLKQFLITHINLKLKKEKLTKLCLKNHKSYNYPKFLDYVLIMKINHSYSNKTKSKLTKNSRLILKVDYAKVIQELAAKGFCTKDGVAKPKFTYISQTQTVTNWKVNKIFTGILYYYKLAHNLKPFKSYLFSIFSHSLAKLYAAKFKMHKKNKIFKIGKRDLSLPLKSKNNVYNKLNNLNSLKLKGFANSNTKTLTNFEKINFNKPLKNLNHSINFKQIIDNKGCKVYFVSELLKKYGR